MQRRINSTAAADTAILDTVIFDIGNVLVRWNPRNLYRKLFDDALEMEEFLAEVCTQSWNEQVDEGRSTAEITAELIAEHPEKAPLIEAYYDRFSEMMTGTIEGTAELVLELEARQTRLYALTNFSRETFPLAQARFDVLGRFAGIVVSGEERVRKPDPRIFEILFSRHSIDPGRALFIDDVAANIEAAAALGLRGHLFTSPDSLRGELAALGLL